MAILRSVVAGLATGYAAKACQMIASLLLVPFLLRADKLGLAGYGTLAALTATAAGLAVPLDGWRLDVARRAGVGARSGLLCRKTIVLQCAVGGVAAGGLCGLVFLAQGALLGLLGFSENEISVVSLLAVLAQVIVFQVMFPVEATLHAVGKTYSVNVLMTAEVILRVLIVVVMFIALPASIEGYLLVFTGLLAGRAVVEAVILRKLVASVCSESVPTLAAEVNALWSSSVLMLQGLSAFSVFRAPVLLANKVMGSEAAAVISILVATVRTYLYQALISSVQPMMVPIAARIGVREMTQEQVRLVRDLLGAHQTASTALCLFVAITAPAWLDLWLGQTFAVFALAATVMTLTVSVEVSAIVISQVVVSQGYGALLSVANAVMSTVVVAVMVAVSSWWPDPLAVACVISVYVILWHGVISRVIYRQKVGGGIDGLRQTVGTIGLALGVAAVVGYLVSAGERSAVSIAGFGAAGVVMYLGLAEMTLGGGRQMVRAGRSVRAALKRRDP